MATGNQWQMYTDLTVQARAMPIGWSRTYNSRSEYAGPLGYGWTFEYGVHLEERSDGAVILREGDGTEHLFIPDPGGGFQSPAGKHLALTETPTGFEMRDKEGTASSFDLSGRLLSITDSNSNAVTLTYDGGGNLAVDRRCRRPDRDDGDHRGRADHRDRRPHRAEREVSIHGRRSHRRDRCGRQDLDLQL